MLVLLLLLLLLFNLFIYIIIIIIIIIVVIIIREIYKFVLAIWKREILLQQWKVSIIVPTVCKKGENIIYILNSCPTQARVEG